MIVEVCAVTLSLFLMLYGLIQAAMRVSVCLFRPDKPKAVVVLWLEKGDEDAEEKLRYARMIAGDRRVPLIIADDGLDTTEREVIQTMLSGGGGVYCAGKDLQNIVQDACT